MASGTNDAGAQAGHGGHRSANGNHVDDFLFMPFPSQMGGSYGAHAGMAADMGMTSAYYDALGPASQPPPMHEVHSELSPVLHYLSLASPVMQHFPSPKTGGLGGSYEDTAMLGVPMAASHLAHAHAHAHAHSAAGSAPAMATLPPPGAAAHLVTSPLMTQHRSHPTLSFSAMPSSAGGDAATTATAAGGGIAVAAPAGSSGAAVPTTPAAMALKPPGGLVGRAIAVTLPTPAATRHVSPDASPFLHTPGGLPHAHTHSVLASPYMGSPLAKNSMNADLDVASPSLMPAAAPNAVAPSAMTPVLSVQDAVAVAAMGAPGAQGPTGAEGMLAHMALFDPKHQQQVAAAAHHSWQQAAVAAAHASAHAHRLADAVVADAPHSPIVSGQPLNNAFQELCDWMAVPNAEKTGAADAATDAAANIAKSAATPTSKLHAASKRGLASGSGGASTGRLRRGPRTPRISTANMAVGTGTAAAPASAPVAPTASKTAPPGCSTPTPASAVAPSLGLMLTPVSRAAQLPLAESSDAGPSARASPKLNAAASPLVASTPTKRAKKSGLRTEHAFALEGASLDHDHALKAEHPGERQAPPIDADASASPTRASADVDADAADAVAAAAAAAAAMAAEGAANGAFNEHETEALAAGSSQDLAHDDAGESASTDDSDATPSSADAMLPSGVSDGYDGMGHDPSQPLSEDAEAAAAAASAAAAIAMATEDGSLGGFVPSMGGYAPSGEYMGTELALAEAAAAALMRAENLRRNQVKVACIHCKKACKKCDNKRPCDRCHRLGFADCEDAPRKERNRGFKRGPYKKNNLARQASAAAAAMSPIINLSRYDIGEHAATPELANMGLPDPSKGHLQSPMLSALGTPLPSSAMPPPVSGSGIKPRGKKAIQKAAINAQRVAQRQAAATAAAAAHSAAGSTSEAPGSGVMLPLGFSSDSGPDRFDPAQPFTPAQLEAGLPGGDMPQGMVGPADGLTTDGLPADSTAFFAGAHPGFSGAMGAFEGSAAGPGYPGGGAMGAAMAAHPHAFMFNDLVPGAEMHGLPAHLMNPMSGAAHLQGYAPTGYEMDPRQQGYAQQFASPQQHAVTPQEYAHMVYYDDAKLLQSPYLMSDNGNAAVAAAAVAAAAAAASAVGHEESLPAAASAAEPHLSLAV